MKKLSRIRVTVIPQNTMGIHGTDPFPKRLPKFEALYCSVNPNHKVSNQFKRYDGFLIYPPLWTSYLVAMHDDIENRSINSIANDAKPSYYPMVIQVSAYADDFRNLHLGLW